MERLEGMRALVDAVDAGSLAAAAKKARKSPASITRAIDALEAAVGVQLLVRTTRSLGLTAEGEGYLVACRRILADVEAARDAAVGTAAEPSGTLVVTAPALFGRKFVRPIVDAFVAKWPRVTVRLLLVDRIVDLAAEGVDVAVRIGHLPDSALIAVRVGEVRQIVCASPKLRRVTRVADLAKVDTIAQPQLMPGDVWVFGTQRVKVRPRLVVNDTEAAIASAVAGMGVVVALSYQVEAELRAGRLVRLLAAHEPEPVPIHVVYPAGSARVRAFVDVAVKTLRGPVGA